MSPTRCRAGRVAVDVTIEAGDALHADGLIRLAIRRGVELLLRELCDEQTDAFKVFRVEDALEDFLEVIDGDQLPLGDIAEIGSRGQKDGRRELRQEVLGQIKVEVEALHPRKLLDFHLGENHAADFVMRMRQRQEALGEEVLVAQLIRCGLGELLPAHAFGERVAGPTGIGLPRVIFTFLSGRARRSYRASRTFCCRAMTASLPALSLAIMSAKLSRPSSTGLT